MSYADTVFIQNIREILDHGVWDTDQNVRPHWEDGTPAHTIKKFGIVNRYDLQKEFPILTLRRTYWKTAVDELLWIWQKKSNNVHDLNSHGSGTSGRTRPAPSARPTAISWASSTTIPRESMDQVDRVLYDLKHNPASRRILTNIYNFADLS